MLDAPQDSASHLQIALPPSASLPIARYRFRIRMRQGFPLPEYAGALLRGQFGAALRHLSCTEHERRCSACHRLSNCAYPEVFESSGFRNAGLSSIDTPNPYVIEPPPMEMRCVAAGGEMVFHMVLIGSALRQLAVIAESWQRAVRVGLGRARVTGELESIEWLPPQGPAALVWQADTAAVAPHDPLLIVPRFETVRKVRLTLRTPLRLQQRGCLVNVQQLLPVHLLAAISRRASLLLDLPGEMALGQNMSTSMWMHEAGSLRDCKSLRWWDWTRYSARQKREMTLGGLLGHWTIEGDLKRWLPLLWIGQWLHAGKNSTFGLGGFELE